MPDRPATRSEIAQATDPAGGSGFPHHAHQHATGQTSQGVAFLGAEWRRDLTKHLQPRCFDFRGQPPSDRGERDGSATPVCPRTPTHQAVSLQPIDQSDSPRLGQADHLGQLVHRRTVEELVERRQRRCRRLGQTQLGFDRLDHPVGRGQHQGPEHIGGVALRRRRHRSKSKLYTPVDPWAADPVPMPSSPANSPRAEPRTTSKLVRASEPS
jgi:hypothetical protein